MDFGFAGCNQHGDRTRHGNLAAFPQAPTVATGTFMPFMHPAASASMGSTLTNAARETDARFGMANGRTVRQGSSDIDTLSDAQGVFEFNAEVAHCTVDFRVTKQQLNCAEVASFSVDLRRLCPAK